MSTRAQLHIAIDGGDAMGGGDTRLGGRIGDDQVAIERVVADTDQRPAGIRRTGTTPAEADLACHGDAATDAIEHQLPAGVTRIARLGGAGNRDGVGGGPELVLMGDDEGTAVDHRVSRVAIGTGQGEIAVASLEQTIGPCNGRSDGRLNEWCDINRRSSHPRRGCQG